MSGESRGLNSVTTHLSHLSLRKLANFLLDPWSRNWFRLPIRGTSAAAALTCRICCSSIAPVASPKLGRYSFVDCRSLCLAGVARRPGRGLVARGRRGDDRGRRYPFGRPARPDPFSGLARWLRRAAGDGARSAAVSGRSRRTVRLRPLPSPRTPAATRTRRIRACRTWPSASTTGSSPSIMHAQPGLADLDRLARTRLTERASQLGSPAAGSRCSCCWRDHRHRADRIVAGSPHGADFDAGWRLPVSGPAGRVSATSTVAGYLDGDPARASTTSTPATASRSTWLAAPAAPRALEPARAVRPAAAAQPGPVRRLSSTSATSSSPARSPERFLRVDRRCGRNPADQGHPAARRHARRRRAASTGTARTRPRIGPRTS